MLFLGVNIPRAKSINNCKHDVERCGSGLWQDRSQWKLLGGLERLGNKKKRGIASCIKEYREETMEIPSIKHLLEIDVKTS
jgi:hypothetical protein